MAAYAIMYVSGNLEAPVFVYFVLTNKINTKWCVIFYRVKQKPLLYNKYKYIQKSFCYYLWTFIVHYIVQRLFYPHLCSL